MAQTLKAADIQTTIADDIEQIQWSKLATNCAYNVLSAVASISYGPMSEVEGTKDVVASAVQEVVIVARASGVSMPEDLLEQILKIPAAMPTRCRPPPRISRAANLAKSTFSTPMWCGKAPSWAFRLRPIMPSK